MKKLIWDDDVEEIDLGDGDFVQIGSGVTVKDMVTIRAGESQMDISSILLKKLVRNWRGPSFERNGEAVPCTEENVERMDMQTARFISDIIAAKIIGDRMDDETKKESTSSSSPISVAP